MSDMDTAVDAAVVETLETYDDAEKHPLDHGYAYVTGVDLRTSLGRALKAHEQVTVDDNGNVTVDSVNRYASAQSRAYNALLLELEERGVEHDAHVESYHN